MLKTEGIVLSELRFKDTSKIINIYTKSLGKIPVMANGAYKANSKLMASTQVLSHNDYVLQKGKSFYYLNQGNIIEAFYSIREDIEKFIYASYILELIEKSSPEEEKNEMLFLLLEKSLKILSKLDKDFSKFTIAFQLKFVSFIGYRPYLKNCVICNRSHEDYLKWSNEEGGLICKNCFHIDRNSMPIDKATYKAMVELLYIPLEELEEIDVTKEVLESLQKIIEKYILYNIDRKEFNSLKMLKMLN